MKVDYPEFDEERLYIILDACRFDAFQEVISKYDIHSSKLKCKYSYGRCTKEFYDNIPENKNLNIITANPYPYFVRFKFNKVIITSDVIPSHNIKEYKKINPKNPTILHLIPPHVPWMGEKGKIAYKTFMEKHGYKDGLHMKGPKRHFGPMSIEYKLFSYYGREKAWRYYTENLDFGLKAIFDNLDKLPDNFIITSDHGNLFGEHGKWGHPNTIECSELRMVPWMEFHKE